ncbi:MAG: hypothetical protein K8S16_15325 [Bacteroidales bacterium]|nr:hypothetical protein [Bacteroidales bacterium]
MTEWWESLSSFEQVFWYIAVPFSVILLIQMILTFSGMGGGDSDIGGGDTDISGMDLDADTDINLSDISDAGEATDVSNISDADISFHFFTVRNFIAFFTMFGWAGIAAWNEGLSKTWTITVAVVVGGITMAVVSALFYYMSKLQDAGGSLKIRNALNKVGSVYIPIEAAGGNVGKVQITIQDALREMPAITKGDEDLATGTVIKVVGIVSNSILVVQKISK